MKYYIFGKHASLLALKNPRRDIIKTFCSKEIYEKYRPIINKYPYQILDSNSITNFMANLLGTNSVHQGIAIKVNSISYNNINNLKDNVSRIAILDQITDINNIGAILRSAAAFAIEAVIVSDNKSAKENGSMAKVASGGLEFVQLIRVVNLSSAIKYLKKQRFWIVGMDRTSDKTLNAVISSNDKIAIILGSESKGMRRLVKESCDFICKINMTSKIDSLNVSSAAAICFHELYNIQKYL